MAQHTPLKPERAPWVILLSLLTARNDKEFIRRGRLLRRTARTLPGLKPYFDLTPPRRPGRPKGRLSIDLGECYGMAIAIHYADMSKAAVLRALEKDPPEPHHYRWLDRRLKIGRQLLRKKPQLELRAALQRGSLIDRHRWGSLFVKALVRDLSPTERLQWASFFDERAKAHG